MIDKKNRNLYSMLLLDMVLRERLDKPFSEPPDEASLPVLSMHYVVGDDYPKKSRLSAKFHILKREGK